jgi:hypothetical protein
MISIPFSGNKKAVFPKGKTASKSDTKDKKRKKPASLRWHYPDQVQRVVTGNDMSRLLTLSKAPLAKIQYSILPETCQGVLFIYQRDAAFSVKK